MGDPEGRAQAEDGSQCQGLERTFPHNSAAQEKEQPNKAGVMWLEKQSDGEKNHADELITPIDKTPSRNGAKADGGSGDVANFEKELTVGKHKADEATGEQAGCFTAEVKHENGGQREERSSEENPEILRNRPRKEGKGNDNKERGRKVNVPRDREPAFSGSIGIGQEPATFRLKLLKDSNWIVGINMAERAAGTVVNSAEVDHHRSTWLA